MLLMKARPVAAPTAVRKRVGIGQKSARAEVIPTSATVSVVIATIRLPDSTDAARPTAARAQAMVRLLIFLPVRSTRQAHQSMATLAKKYGMATRNPTVRSDTPLVLMIC